MTWAMNMRDERKIGRAEGRAEGLAKGLAEGIQQGVLGTLVSLVTERMLPYEVGRERSGLTDEEFRAKIAEVDPDFQK
jgi:flagellar biosynthesis/type III secretory pathway protein FliH